MEPLYRKIEITGPDSLPGPGEYYTSFGLMYYYPADYDTPIRGNWTGDFWTKPDKSIVLSHPSWYLSPLGEEAMTDVERGLLILNHEFERESILYKTDAQTHLTCPPGENKDHLTEIIKKRETYLKQLSNAIQSLYFAPVLIKELEEAKAESTTLAELAWNQAIIECATVQEKGWAYTPKSFKEWLTAYRQDTGKGAEND